MFTVTIGVRLSSWRMTSRPFASWSFSSASASFAVSGEAEAFGAGAATRGTAASVSANAANRMRGSFIGGQLTSMRRTAKLAVTRTRSARRAYAPLVMAANKSTRLNIVTQSLHDSLERLRDMPATARVRELRTKAQAYERAVRQ